MYKAFAPSNIALIKYMGKAPGSENVPLNTSLSYTLPHLQTCVELDLSHEAQDSWAPLETEAGFHAPILSVKAQTRFLTHLARIKNHYNCNTPFIVRSANNFPHSAGLASSASSFAALTKAAVLACAKETGKPELDINVQANLSRLGSGSSCRSFFTPWVVWTDTEVTPITLPYDALIHQVILLHAGEKEVSSSEAHRRVSQLPEYPKRKVRAENNLARVLNALNTQNWQTAYEVCFDEFLDMHALFEQCKPSFSYITPKVREVLNMLQQDWKTHGDGPIVTMDAGPNIHLLYRPAQAQVAAHLKQRFVEQGIDVI